MQPLANTLLLVEGVILVIQSYRVSGYVNISPNAIAPGRERSAVRLRRVYLVSLPLAALCFVVTGLHAALRGTLILGPSATVAAFVFAAGAILAIIWCAVEIKRDRKGYRLN